MSAIKRVLAALTLAAATVAAGNANATVAAEPEPGRALARVAAPVSELAAARPLAVPGGGAIERYRQRAGGLPVLGAEAVIARPPGAAPILVSDHTVAELGDPAAAEVSRAAAVRAALTGAGVERLRGAARARLAVDRSGTTVWEVLVPSAAPLADFAVRVDARDGEVLATTDLLRYATGAAALYNPNPVVTLGSASGLRDRKDRDSDLLTSLRVPVALERLAGTDGCLEGTYADVRLGRGKRAKDVCAPGAEFTGVTRSANAFEALMAYFHIDRTRAYIDSLGLTQGLRDKPQIVEANSLRQDNSFYSPITRRIGIGTGGVDDGEDGDVIVHEYGHSLQDQQARFFGEEFEGASMGEGFGDYIAAAMSAGVTGGNPTFDPCMFEWDATSYTQNMCLRRTTKPLTAAKAERKCGRSPHCWGQAWSGALYELRGLLGVDTFSRSIMDRVVLESHFMLNRRAKFRDGARALIAADGLLYGGANSDLIEVELVSRGFCKRSC